MSILKRIPVCIFLFFTCSVLFAGDFQNSQKIKKNVQKFFELNKQEYIELSDEENYDLYFLGKKDLFFYPLLLNNSLRYEHYVFEKKYSQKELDDFILNNNIEIRSCADVNGNSFIIMKLSNIIILRESIGNYLKFEFKEKLLANL